MDIEERIRDVGSRFIVSIWSRNTNKETKRTSVRIGLNELFKTCPLVSGYVENVTWPVVEMKTTVLVADTTRPDICCRSNITKAMNKSGSAEAGLRELNGNAFWASVRSNLDSTVGMVAFDDSKTFPETSFTILPASCPWIESLLVFT